MKKIKLVAIATMLAILSSLTVSTFAATTTSTPDLNTTVVTTTSTDLNPDFGDVTQSTDPLEYQNYQLNEDTLIVTNVSTDEQYPVLSWQNVDNTISCTQIIVKNSSATVTKWQVLDTKGTVLYTTGKYLASQTCTINLDKLNIPANTQIKLKAAVEGKDSTCGTIFKYVPGGDFFQTFKLTGTVFKTSLKYLGGFSI